MPHHRHHIPGRALRLLMARPRRDTDAEHILLNEIGDCSFCWFLVANALGDMIIAEIDAQICEHPHMNREGFARWFAHNIAKALDAEALDAADDDAA
jgi:hypothetical protein